jgi:hypothetical protein
MFYVAPLFLVALLVWIDRGLARPQPQTVVAAVIAGALPLTVPYDRFIGLNAVSDTAALLPLGWLVERGLSLDYVWAVVLAGCAVAVVAFVYVPRRYALALPALVLVYFAVSQHPVVAEHRFRAAQHLFGGITNPHRDWVDRAVGGNGPVGLVWTGTSDKFTVWENEIFNRSVGTIYTTGPAVPGGLAQTPLVLDRRTGFLRRKDGSLVRSPFVLTDSSLELNGRVAAVDATKRMFLYRLRGPLQQLAFIGGIYPQDTWSGRYVTYVRHNCRGGTLAVGLQSDTGLFAEPNGVTARIGGRVVRRALVAPDESMTIGIPLVPVHGECTVRFAVDRTAVPKLVTGGQNPDPRRLGMHFTFRYRP